MRRVLLPLVLLLLLLATAAPARAAIPWIKGEIDTAFAEAKVKDRPLLVYFYTSWCSFCLELDDKVFTDDDVTAASDAFVPLRINCDHGACNPLWKKYGLNSLPTVLVLTPKGDVLGRLAMYRPVPEFLRFLKECQDPRETLTAVDKRIREGDRSPLVLMRSAEQHFEANDFEGAASRYRKALDVILKDQPGLAPDAYLGLARIKSNRGDDKGALGDYYTVLRSYPESSRLPEAFVSILVILREQNRTKEIDGLFQEFGARFPDDPAVLNDHARRLLESGGDLATALEKASKAASLSPSTAEYQATEAQTLLSLKRPVDALEAVNRAIRLRPTDTDYRMLRLEILETVPKAPSPAAEHDGGPARKDTATRGRAEAVPPPPQVKPER